MRNKLFCLLLLLLPLFSLAQSVETIKSSPDYLWGEGWGESIREADQMALQTLVSKISLSVENAFVNVEKEVAVNGVMDASTAIESVMKTYSQATLTNTDQIVISQEPDAQVFRYVRRDEVEKIFEGRKNKVIDMVGLAEKALEKRKIDDVLRYYYWSFCLLRSLPDANNVTSMDGAVLMTWIPNRINEVLSNLKVQKSSVDEDFVTIYITYNDQPVASLDYTYFDGRGYTNIYSATDGIGIMEMQPGVSKQHLKIKCEYEYAGEAQIDKEIATVVEVMKGRNFRSAYINVSDESLSLKAKDASLLASPVEDAVLSMDAGQFSKNDLAPYKKVMEKVIGCIKAKDYHSAEPYFTENGAEMFRKLLNYGNARILEEPDLSYLRMGDEVLCRSIPMSFSFRNNTRKFVENVTFTFDASQKINCVAFGLGEEATADILNRDSYSEQARMILTQFLENYKTAFALKRLDYIQSIFDDNALIITGTEVKTSVYKNNEERARFMDNKIIRYNRFTKNEYIKHLERCFASNEYVNIRFANNDIVKAGDRYGEVYGIQIKQDYYSTNYGDTGYLFLYVDLNDPDNPIIKVRTWQPDRDPDFGLYGLGDF